MFLSYGWVVSLLYSLDLEKIRWGLRAKFLGPDPRPAPSVKDVFQGNLAASGAQK